VERGNISQPNPRTIQRQFSVFLLSFSLVKVKNISKESLEKHGQGIEALFINIEWNKKNQKIEDVKNLKI